MFIDIATPLAKMGIPVIPVEPYEKRCLVPEWQKRATTDLQQIERWNAENPLYNVGCVGKPNGVVILDCDVKGLKKRIEEETGQNFPRTLIVKSAGKGAAHIYFRQNESSRKLGNRKAKGLFDLQSVDRYVVGPGSQLEGGKYYETVQNAPLAEFPEWLCYWIEKNSDAEKARRGKGVLTDEDFDFDAFLRHYGIAGHQSGEWFVGDVCPISGRKHEQSTRTGFYWEGGYLGFHCFAAGCEGSGMGIGEVIRHLNRTHEPYDGPIWPQDEHAVDWANIDADDVVPEEPSETGTVQHAENAEKVASVAEGHPLAFPEEAIANDKLGDWARLTELPLGIAYPAVLACVSVKPDLERMCGARVNLYVGLLVRPGGGKNEAIRRSLIVTGIDPEDFKKSAPGGDGQLVTLLGDRPKRRTGDSPEDRIPGPKKMLLVTNEIGDVLAKTTIDNSTLASRLCDFWDDSQYSKTVGNREVYVDCRLSWLGGMPVWLENPEKFNEYMGAETNFGLYPRFIFGYNDVELQHRDWSYETLGHSEVMQAGAGLENFDNAVAEQLSSLNNGGVTVVERIDDEAQAIYDAWNPEVEHRGRIKYNAKKIAILKAAFNDEQEVNALRMSQAIRFMEWQIKIRDRFKPGDAKESNKEAWFADRLIPALERAGAYENFVSWRRISLDNRWDRKIDPSVQLRAVMSLVELGRLIEEEVDDDARKAARAKGRKRLYPKVMLRRMK